MKSLIAVVVFAVLAAGCGGASSTPEPVGAGSAPPVPTVEAPVTTATSQSSEPADTTETTDTTAAAESTTTPPAEEAPPTTEPPIDGPAAPAFELALHSGDMFSLVGEQKPIYLVFWAEW